jgi:hypothetical protein
MKLKNEPSCSGMKTSGKQEDKKRNISVENNFKEEKTKNYLIDIDILEPYVKFV